MIGCLQVVRIYRFMKVIKVTKQSFYIRSKICSPYLYSLVKRSAKFENSRASENLWLCLGFLLIYSQIFPNVCLGFHQTIKHGHHVILLNNFSLHNTYKTGHLVMRNWELIKQSKQLKIKSKILLNLFNEKYGHKFGEFNNWLGLKGLNVEEKSNKNNQHTRPIFLWSLLAASSWNFFHSFN